MKAFISPMLPVSNPNNWQVSRNPNVGSKGTSTVTGSIAKLINAVPDEIKSQAYTYVTDKGEQLLRRKFAGSGKGDRNKTRMYGGSNGSSNDNNGGGSGGHSSGYALSKAPNPLKTSLDTGITPNTYTSDYLDAQENACSPLHLSGALIQIPSTGTNKLFEYFKSVIAFDIQTKAQANVGFNLNIATDFTPTAILTAVNALLNALQVYFFYMSIVSYHSDPSNKNEGMIFLRTQMTSQFLESLEILGRRLADTPCPPKLYELVRYMSATYISGDNQGAPLIKTVPHYLNGPNIVNYSAITGALDAMKDDTNNKIYSLLRRAVPQWNPKVLYDVTPTPILDLNFITIFSNLPFSNFGAVIAYYPQVTASTIPIAYNSYTNTLDGVAFALCGARDTVANEWIPGLVKPPAGNGNVNTDNSRMSFYQVGGNKAFFDVKDYPFLCRSRQETYYNITEAAVSSCHLFGADRCLNVTADTIRETSMKSLDYLMSAETIPNSKSGSNNNVARSNRNRRG